VYEYIREFIGKKGYPPSVREIGEGTGLASSSTVHAHMKQLENKGYIKCNPSEPRALWVVDPPPDGKTELDWFKDECARLQAENEQLRALLNKDGERVE
jgi:SOS-response transcriptional repressor LexA